MALARLILIESLKPSRSVLIDKARFVIGRGEECDLVLDHSGISKQQAVISFDGELYTLEDSGSKNGTSVNGTMVRRHVLQDHDVISMGGADLSFRKVPEQQLAADLEADISKFRFALQSTSAIISHQLLDPVLNEIINGLMRLSQADRGFLMLEDEKGKLQMARSVNIDHDELKKPGSQLSLSAVEKAIQDKHSVVISNAQQDTYFGNQTSVQELALKTLVCIPILLEGHAIGLLYADSNRREHAFTFLDVEVLESLAENAAIAIRNARLSQQIWNLMHQTSEVLSQIHGSGHLEDVLKERVKTMLDSLQNLKGVAGGKRA